MADIQHFLINITKNNVSVSEFLDIRTIQNSKIPYVYCFSIYGENPVIEMARKYKTHFLDTNGLVVLPKINNFTVLFAMGQSSSESRTVRTIWLNIADKYGNIIKFNSYKHTTESFLKNIFQILLDLKGVDDITPFLRHFKVSSDILDMYTFAQFPKVMDKLDSQCVLKDTKIKKDKTIINQAVKKISISKETQVNPFQTIFGLEQVKREVTELIQIVKLRDEKIKRGLNYTPQTLHMVFTGNPGTGKTVVARIIAEEFKRINVLEKGHIVEVDRSKLVEKYVGHTAKKTAEVIQSAMGEVLFIDEAYSLVNKGENDFGIEVIDTLVKFMEDYRDKFVLIVAGYPDKMLSFLDSNPGLASRFYKTINFPDYSISEMIEIFKIFCQKSGYHLRLENESVLINKLQEKVTDDSANFGNARGVRKWFEGVERNQNLRVAQKINLSNEEIMTILNADL